MRILTTINDLSDIYLPITQEDIELVEAELHCKLPQELNDLYLNPDLELIKTLPTLLWPVHHDALGIIETNKSLQSSDHDPYPPFLIAFATNECGDFWVIDTRDQSVTYIDPDKNVEESLTDDELYFRDFAEWLNQER